MNSLRLLLSHRRYFAPAWIFASLNIVVGTWVLYLPDVRDALNLSEGQIGIALFCFSAGLLTMIPFAARLLSKIGLGRGTFYAILSFAALMCLPVQMPSYLLLCVSLYAAGLTVSLTDIGMNALLSEIEQEDEGNFMSAAHGFFSLGGVIGAGIGTLLKPYFAQPAFHFYAVFAFLLLTNGLLSSSYIGHRGRQRSEETEGKFSLSLVKPLLGLTVLSMIIMGSEGAVEHWSKLYLLDVVRVDSDQLAGYGFVAFSAMMTLGRFLGDGISARIGSFRLIIGGSTLAALGFGLTLVATYTASMIGFSLVGLGFSVIIPELFRVAGRARGISAAEGIAVVAGMGYVGFIASPAILGFLAEWRSLRVSFLALMGAAVVAGVLGVVLRARARVRG